MNHIKQLQLEIELLKSTLNEHRGDILDLERYLTSDKFYHDTSVQVSDVLRRLPTIYSEGEIR